MSLFDLTRPPVGLLMSNVAISIEMTKSVGFCVGVRLNACACV